MSSYVTVLGTLATEHGGTRLEPPYTKLTALLYFLAYQPGWVSRDNLSYLFYPDTEKHRARQNLRPLLIKLRRLECKGLEAEPNHLR